jgi:hypothetical protein
LSPTGINGQTHIGFDGFIELKYKGSIIGLPQRQGQFAEINAQPNHRLFFAQGIGGGLRRKRLPKKPADAEATKKVFTI